MSAELTIGFLGAGQMATALAQGLVRAGLVRPEGLVASDVSVAARERFARETQGRVLAANSEVAAVAGTLVLAVKPLQVDEVLKELAPQIGSGHLLVSLAAGVRLAKLEAALPAGTRVVRVMPNTPALVGEGASGFALGRAAGREDAEWTARLLGAVGLAFEVPERLLDAVTGLSGSGPAYACLMIEALSDGGVAAGLPRDLATRLAAQTLLGTARMVLETGLHPGVLKDRVTSPGGTTIEGLHQLERAGVRGALLSAVRAAADKSRQLGGD
ncbi:MAG: pyrroline-5-carboxylate reductase [Verrucomicrobiales bacterium]|nr:pyrroline-5-carboxylate reductase [Verrucomicrobiales bacterium]